MPRLSQGTHWPNGPEMRSISESTGNVLSITLQMVESYCLWVSGTHYGAEGKNILEMHKTWYGMFRGRKNGKEKEVSN